MLDGERAYVGARRHPGLPYVWIGGALVAVALAGSARRTKHSPTSHSPTSHSPTYSPTVHSLEDSVESLDRRRSRLSASSEANVEPSSELAPFVGEAATGVLVEGEDVEPLPGT